MSETRDAILGAAEIIADTAIDIFAIYAPIVSTINSITKRIYENYQDAECNQQICGILAQRVKNAGQLIEKIITDIGGNQERFRKKSYYMAFKRYENTLQNIEEFTKKVSKYKGFVKYFTAKVTKERLKSLTEDYDTCIRDLQFAMVVTNEQDRKEEAKKVEESLNELEDSLRKLDIGVNQKLDAVVASIDLLQSQIDQSKTDNKSNEIQAQRVGQNELCSPHVKTEEDIRDGGSVIKKFYKDTIEVACKHIVNIKIVEGELAILGKLSQSPYILRFYGLTNFDNHDYMVLDWAKYGTLKNVYTKFDIPWTRKIKIIRNICRGLVYLRSLNIFHHDLRCKNVYVGDDLEPKLGNFRKSRIEEGPTSNLSSILTDVVHWMAPELLEKYQSTDINEISNKKKYTFHCEVFSFGMLIWELCYEKIPYNNWNIQDIFKHVLSGQREKLLRGKFKKEDDKKIQEEFIKIIPKTWQQVPYERIEIARLDKKLEKLSINYPIAFDEPLLEKNETLDFEGDKNEQVYYTNSSEKQLIVEDKQSNSIKIMPTIKPLEEGLKYHRNKQYLKAWQCIKDNAEIGNKDAKFWKGYYLTNGYGVVEPDPAQAMELYKEAADYGHFEAQYRYAALLLQNLKKDDDEETKQEKCEKIIRYYKSAADNKNADAMYSLGDIYLNGKLRAGKNKQLGLEYLKSAAGLKNEKAISMLESLEKTEISVS